MNVQANNNVHARKNKVHAPKRLPEGSGARSADLVASQVKFFEGGVVPVDMPMPSKNTDEDDSSRTQRATPQNTANKKARRHPPKHHDNEALSSIFRGRAATNTDRARLMHHNQHNLQKTPNQAGPDNMAIKTKHEHHQYGYLNPFPIPIAPATPIELYDKFNATTWPDTCFNGKTRTTPQVSPHPFHPQSRLVS